MATDKERQQLEQIKELISTAKKLTVQLISFELDIEANKNFIAGSLVPKSNGNEDKVLRPHGYVNWNSTHDILKTTHWKKMIEFTIYCGLIERGSFGVSYCFERYINMAKTNVVNEKVRFHEVPTPWTDDILKVAGSRWIEVAQDRLSWNSLSSSGLLQADDDDEDDLFLNVSSPLVQAQILFLKELRKPTPELVKYFLDTVKNDMHTRSSFEEKYGLKWVEPGSEPCVVTAPMQEPKLLAPILSPINEQGTTPVIAVTCSLREDANPRKVDSAAITFTEEYSNEDEKKVLEIKEVGSAEKPTNFSNDNLVDATRKTLEPKEVDSGKEPNTFRKDNLHEDDQKTLKLTEVDSAEKPILFSEENRDENDQKTLEIKEVDLTEKPITFSEQYPNEDDWKALELKEVCLTEEPITFSKKNLVEESLNTLEPKEANSAKQLITFSKDNLVEDDQKTLKLTKEDSAEKTIKFSEKNLNENDQKTPEVNLTEKLITFGEEYPKEDDLNALELNERDSTEDPITLSQKNSGNDGQKTWELTEVDSADKPTIFSEKNPDEKALKTLELEKINSAKTPIALSEENSDEDDQKTIELYEKFSEILEKVAGIRFLEKSNFTILLRKVKELEISSEKRLRIVVDLLLEKAIEEPEFSKNYAAFCKELVTLKVPSENNPAKCVRFKNLLIGKCQNQFEEKLLGNDPENKDEFQMMTDEEIRRTRAVATVRFIGELYKYEMFTCIIMNYCLSKLTENWEEEEKLECLCELLTIIGKQMECEKSSMPSICLKKMEELVVSKSNTISNRVILMVKGVVDLGKSKWVFKSFDSHLKTMDQIQKEAEVRAPYIKWINAKGTRGSLGGDGEDCGQGHKGGGDNLLMDKFPQARSLYYSVDTLQLIADMQDIQNYIKLPPASFKGISKNMFSIFMKFQADPTSRGNMFTVNRDAISAYHSKNASNDKSRSVMDPEPLTISHKRLLKSIIDNSLINPSDEELVAKVNQLCPPQYHTAVIKFILEMACDKTVKQIDMISKSVFHLVATNTIAPENFVTGLLDVLGFAPDIFIDVPMLYDHLGKILAPHIGKHITLAKIFKLCGSIISENQGHLILKAIIYNLKEVKGPKFVKIIWRESGLQISQWMCEKQVPKWIADNKFEFLERGEDLVPPENECVWDRLVNSDEDYH